MPLSMNSYLCLRFRFWLVRVSVHVLRVSACIDAPTGPFFLNGMMDNSAATSSNSLFPRSSNTQYFEHQSHNSSFLALSPVACGFTGKVLCQIKTTESPSSIAPQHPKSRKTRNEHKSINRRHKDIRHPRRSQFSLASKTTPFDYQLAPN